MTDRCSSCRDGFDGSGGSGYQPCCCKSEKGGAVAAVGPDCEVVKCGLKLDLWRGQRVTDGEVTGVLRSLSVDADDSIVGVVVLDQPLVLPACGDVPEISLYTQTMPVYQLRPASPLAEFGVVAGKWDDDGMSCKYAADFASLDEAIKAHDKVADYPWAYIQYKGRVLKPCDQVLELFA